MSIAIRSPFRIFQALAVALERRLDSHLPHLACSAILTTAVCFGVVIYQELSVSYAIQAVRLPGSTSLSAPLVAVGEPIIPQNTSPDFYAACDEARARLSDCGRSSAQL